MRSQNSIISDLTGINMQITIKYIISSLLLTLFSISLAQESLFEKNPQYEDLFEPRLSGEVYSPPDRFANSQNYFANWLRGDIMLISGETVRGQQLQYNAYLDEIFWLHPMFNRQVRLDKQLISSFTAIIDESGKTATFKRIRTGNEGAGNSGFFARLLYEDSISLYSQRILRESSRTRSATVGGTIISRILLISDHKYFLMLEDDITIPVSRNRRSLYNAFPEKRREIRTILRSNRNRIRNEAELIEAIALLNTILITHKPS